MMFAELVRKNRSCRRFDENHIIGTEVLEGLVDLGRLTASAANLQPLKYIISGDVAVNEKIFHTLKWAAYLKGWNGPEKGERPSGYIIMMGDTKISSSIKWDHGIASQTILLGAREKGLAGCMLAAFNKKDLKFIFDLEDHLDILLVLALGKPVEEVVVDPVGPDGSIKYWRDEKNVHHVPKRKLHDLIVKKY